MDDQGVLVVGVVAAGAPIHAPGDNAGRGAAGIDDHELIVHEATEVLNLYRNPGVTERLVLRVLVAGPQRVPDAGDGQPLLRLGQDGVAQPVVGEEEDAEANALVGGVDLREHLVHGPVAGREVDLDRHPVVVDGMGDVVRLMGAEVPGPHFLELQRVDVGQEGGGHDDAVVVVVGEAGVRHVRRTGPDDLAVDDEEFVVHDGGAGVIDHGDAGVFQVGVVSVVCVGVVIGDHAHGDAPAGGRDEGVANGLPIQLVHGGVDGSGGRVQAVEEPLFHGGGAADVPAALIFSVNRTCGLVEARAARLIVARPTRIKTRTSKSAPFLRVIFASPRPALIRPGRDYIKIVYAQTNGCQQARKRRRPPALKTFLAVGGA